MLILVLTVGVFFVSVRSIIVSDCLVIFDIVGFFFNISGFKNRLSLLRVFDGGNGLSSINFVKSSSVDAAVDSISTIGKSGKSGSCGVNEGFLKEENFCFFSFGRISFTLHEFHSLILVEIVFLMHAKFLMVLV